MKTDPQTPKYNLREKKKSKKHLIDPDSDTESDSDYIPGASEDEDEEFNVRQWQKFIGKLFPSKYTNKRNTLLSAMDKLKENKDATDDDEAEPPEDMEEDYDEVYLDNPNMKVNIIFTVAENIEGEYYEDEEEEEEEEEDETVDPILPETKCNDLVFEKGDIIEVKLDKWNEWKEGTILKKKGDAYNVKVNKTSYSCISPEKIRAKKSQP